MGAAAARKNKHAGVCPLQSVQIGLELTLGKRMAQPFGILLKRPIRGVFVDVGPMEPVPAVSVVFYRYFLLNCGFRGENHQKNRQNPHIYGVDLCF